jgi:ribosomal protein S27AE
MSEELKCPVCGSTDLDYLGQIEEDEPFESWECMKCGEIFLGDHIDEED